MGLAALSVACTSDSSPSSGADATSLPAPSATSSSATNPVVPTGTIPDTIPFLPDDACDVAPPEAWLSAGTMHTIVMSTEPVTVRITADPGTVCPGGRVRATVTFRNDGTTTVDLEDLSLILSGGMDKWQLAPLSDVSLAAGQDQQSETVDVTLPLVAPAQYGIFVDGFAPGGVLFLDDPAA